MISVPIRDAAGAESGSYEFDPAELCDAVNKQLLHDVVVMYEASARQGTVRTKSRGMVRGSTRKLFRQKGTGRARAGNARTPVRRGGGHAFGKKPRDFSYRLPRKAVRKATKMALLSKFQDGQAVVVSDLGCSAPRTKVVADALKAPGEAALGLRRPYLVISVWMARIPGTGRLAHRLGRWSGDGDLSRRPPRSCFASRLHAATVPRGPDSRHHQKTGKMRGLHGGCLSQNERQQSPTRQGRSQSSGKRASSHSQSNIHSTHASHSSLPGHRRRWPAIGRSHIARNDSTRTVPR